MLAPLLRRIALIALIAALPLALGCGSDQPDAYPVRGKLTYRGKPVPSGTINFIPDSGPSASAEIQPDGSYSLMAVPGTHSVVIVAMQDMSNRLPEERTPLPPPIVPTKYTSIATSDLKAQVEEKENTANFDLQNP
jgi:hypothetical protein